MKFNIKKVRNIIHLDKDFVSLDGIDNYGKFIYNFSIWANIPQAISNDSILIRVSIFATNPIITSNLFEDAKNSREIIDSLKNYSSKFKSAIKTIRSKPLVSKNIDISANINNSIAKKIKQDPENAIFHLGLKRQIIAVSPKKIIEQDADEVPDLNVSKVEEPVKQDRSIRRAAIKSIFSGIDPSAIGEASFPINNYQSSIQGLNRKSSDLQLEHRSKKKTKDAVWQYGSRRELIQTRANTNVKNNTWSKYLRESLRTSIDKNSESILSTPAKTLVVSKMIQSEWNQITEDIRISSELVGGLQDLHFLIELVNSSGDVLDVKHRIINHDEEVEGFSTPDYAPFVHAMSSGPGKNTVWLKQVDRVATEILLYRRILNYASPDISSEYRLIRKIPLTRYDSHYRVVDWINNSVTCIYRAIAVGPRNKISSTFKNSIVKPIKHSSINKKSTVELEHISIFAQTNEDHVMLRVSNIPQGPISIYITADDLTKKQITRRNKESIRIVGTDPEDQVREISQDTNEIIFTDFDVKHKHIYEYRAVMIYPNGIEITSKITEVHEFIKEFSDESKINVELTGLAIQSDDAGNATVTFNIEPSFTDTGTEKIIESLELSGADKNFILELKNDRNKLNKLLAFSVRRQDSKTGETETFGITAVGQFVDDVTTRGFSKVSPAKAGHSYRYIVQVLLRSSESMFDDVFRDSIDIETTKKFKKKISKFLNPMTLMNSTLPSTGESFGVNFTSKIKPENKFLQGRTGIEVGIDATIPAFKPEIDSIVAQRAGPNKSLIFWTIVGDHNEIDHFVIMAEIHGVKSTVATVHNMSTSGKYHYFDYEVANEPGTVKYSVIPVFSDYAYGIESFAREITLESNMPILTTET